ncbi:hypothetical protein VTK73DRAFT_8466 [Phialemonium thermophilum]|uniref:Ketoreductase domain-containing protein n=1 Tax=Phialemonium thermophilum TaxID=223376 RepID=A0ABR3W8J7_9PEZI
MASSNPARPLESKVFTVTGAARGIGFATAQYLAERGATVSLSDILQSDLTKAEQQIRHTVPDAKIDYTVVDVSDASSVDSWIHATKEKHGRIDGCVNNAGICRFSNIADTSDAEWDLVLGVNLRGVFHCLRAQIPAIADGGSIVNVSSVAGVIGMPGGAAYCASKHGVVALTRCAAAEVAARGIRVNAICPGVIKTPMVDEITGTNGQGLDQMCEPQLLKRAGEPREIAALAGFLLGDESRFTTSSLYTCDGGWTSS